MPSRINRLRLNDIARPVDRLMPRSLDHAYKLLEVGLILSSELSLPSLLRRIVEVAVDVTGARYGALGVLGDDGRIVDFLTTGVTEDERRAIGALPKGGGILGVLIHDARPLRLHDISDDPRSAGFPPNHPPMSSFLGVPIRTRGQVFGNIYLTEKGGGSEFTEEDLESLKILASQAGVAIANARLYEQSQLRERWLKAVGEINAAILAGSPFDAILRLVTRSAQALLGADLATVIVPAGGGGLRITVAEGLHAAELEGMPVPMKDTVSGEVIRTAKPIVLDDAASDPRVHQPMVRAGDVGPVVFVPLTARERTFGTLQVANAAGRRRFQDADVRLLQSFADQASLGLQFTHLKLLEERERIARDINDTIIHSLFAVGLGLQGAAGRSHDREVAREIQDAIDSLDRVIADLRNYVAGLGPGSSPTDGTPTP